jgi:eukaryotic translation initiation factor 2C
MRKHSEGPEPPVPDPNVTSLENEYIQAPATKKQMSTLRLSSRKPGSNGIVLPGRPAFGTSGDPVVLWANYFELKVETETLCKYTVTVTDGQAEGTGKPPVATPVGARLRHIFKEALDVVASKTSIASEYKSQVISLQPLEFPHGKKFKVTDLTYPGGPHAFYVEFSGPSYMEISKLAQYLQTMQDPARDDQFPKFESEIDALGLVLGQRPRTSEAIKALGRGRFFPKTEDAAHRALTSYHQWSPLTMIRGYFQSVRPATGRLLLNANVTHGIFLASGNLGSLFRSWGLAKMDKYPSMSRKDQMSLEDGLHRASRGLHRARLKCNMLSKGGIRRDVTKTMTGLAEKGNGDGVGVRFVPSHLGFAGPNNIRFVLQPPKDGKAPAGKAAATPGPNDPTVSEYFLSSGLFLCPFRSGPALKALTGPQNTKRRWTHRSPLSTLERRLNRSSSLRNSVSLKQLSPRRHT